MNNPLVSIIINNYNYEKYLPEAITSALNQSYPHIEVIVVDDASTDNSRHLIASYKDRVISILRPTNGKQAVALNDGFKASQGEIIIFLDSDDYLFKNAVERIVSVWQEGTAKVHYRLQVVDNFQQPLGYYFPPDTISLAQGEVYQELLRTGDYNSVPMSGNACSRKVLERFFPIPDKYKLTADDYLKISVPFYGKVIEIAEPLGAYRIHNSNQWALNEVSGSRFRRFVQHDLQNYALLVETAEKLKCKVPEDLERRSLGRLWSRLASLRLEPEKHPVATDSSLKLTLWGIQALWQYSNHNLSKRLIYTVWFICVGLLPLFIAKSAITWLYAPHLRPKLINFTLGKVRALVS
jgi:glycosyltransferase involved in cell wall biosynthesis